MRTFAISTLGCKVNAVESDRYVHAMKQANMKQVDFKEKADTYIINTCAVTNAAAAKSRQKIKQAIKNNPDAHIVVVGCSLTADSDNLAKIKEIDTMIYQDDKEHFDEIVLKRKLMSDLSHVNTAKTRAFLKIQDGCEQYCSFCVIPLARGKEKSVDIDQIVEHAKALVGANHKEIVLTGIHIGKYKGDKGESLLSLLKQLVTIEGLERIRISSIEITELHDDLLQFMSVQPKIAKHLHIPLQSANDEVLYNMNRPYTMDYFFKKINLIRQLMPDVMISSDVIAGFVGETNDQFNQSKANIEALELGFLHVFPYSKRKNTVAATLDGHVEASVIKQRTKELLDVSNRLRKQNLANYMLKEVTVLIESKNEKGYFGYSEHYIPVVVMDDECLVNELVKVQITQIANNVCYGKLI